MKKQYTLPFLMLTIASCSPKQDVEVIDMETSNYETGVVIAKSEFVGRRYATETNGSTSDCVAGVGVGITVKSTLSDSSYIFDQQQQPCTQAEVMFDGDLEAHSRSADPSIDIIFNDKYGKLSSLNNIEKTSKIATVLTDSSNDYSINDDLANKQYEQMGLLEVEYNQIRKSESDNRSQETFEAILKDSIKLQKEATLAEARALAREEIDLKEKSMVEAQDKIMLSSVISKKEKQRALKSLTDKTIKLAEKEKELAALKESKEIDANSYEEKLALLEKRVEDYAQLSLLLKRENERLAATGKQSNEFIDKDLNQAEKDAESARYVAMMNMAKNIEIDERLSKALETSQKKALQRKAQRMQTQADTLAYHANADKVFNKDMEKIYQDLQNNMQPAFKGKIARVVGVNVNEEPTIDHVQLLLKENDKSANEILTEIFADVQPMLGRWDIDWKLASHNLQIRDEKWNISAEATLVEFLDYIKHRVKEIHGVDLSIDYFEETRLIVIRDNF